MLLESFIRFALSTRLNRCSDFPRYLVVVSSNEKVLLINISWNFILSKQKKVLMNWFAIAVFVVFSLFTFVPYCSHPVGHFLIARFSWAIDLDQRYSVARSTHRKLVSRNGSDSLGSRAFSPHSDYSIPPSNCFVEVSVSPPVATEISMEERGEGGSSVTLVD